MLTVLLALFLSVILCVSFAHPYDLNWLLMPLLREGFGHT